MTKKPIKSPLRSRPALSGAERQRLYRVKRASVSVDVSSRTAELIRTLRARTSSTVDALLMRALEGLRASLGSERSDGRRGARRAADHKRTRRADASLAQPMSPGDVIDGIQPAQKEPAAHTGYGAVDTCKREKAPETRDAQGSLDL